MRLLMAVVRASFVAGIFTVVQLWVGCRWEPCLGFAVALFFGWCACEAARPWMSLLGLLTISLYVKTVLFGCVAKTLLFQPMDVGVRAPTETAVVFALGFAAVCLAVLLQRLLPVSARPVIRNPADSRSWLVLWFAFLVLGGAGWYFAFHGNIDIVVKNGADVAAISGRIYEVAGFFAQYFPFAPAAAVFYIAAKKGKRLIGHPLVLGSMLVSALPGVLEGRKSPLMIPLAAAGLSVLLLRGVKYKPFWLWTATCLALLMLVVFPFVQYSRFAVEKGSSLADRLETIQEVGRMFLSGADYHEMYEAAVDVDPNIPPYLPRKAASLDRFIRYVDAGRLIDATLTSGRYTGLFTIEWGLRQIPPRSLYPDKPLGFINNWFSRYTGDATEDNERAQFAYGFMASFFNAFGYTGVFFGSLLLYYGMMLCARFLFEGRSGPTIWMIVVFFTFETSLVEDTAGAMLTRIWIPVYILFYSFGLRFFSTRILGGLWRWVGSVGRRWPQGVPHAAEGQGGQLAPRGAVGRLPRPME